VLDLVRSVHADAENVATAREDVGGRVSIVGPSWHRSGETISGDVRWSRLGVTGGGIQIVGRQPCGEGRTPENRLNDRRSDGGF
jgi:hypothetical protein